MGSFPASRRYPREGNGYPLHFSCLENWIFISNEKTVHLPNTSGSNKTDSTPSLPENTVKENRTNPWPLPGHTRLQALIWNKSSLHVLMPRVGPGPYGFSLRGRGSGTGSWHASYGSSVFRCQVLYKPFIQLHSLN